MQGLSKNFAVDGPFVIRRKRFFDGWNLRDVDSGNTMITAIVSGLCERPSKGEGVRFDLHEVKEYPDDRLKHRNGTYWRLRALKEAA